MYGPSGCSAHLRGVVRGLSALGHDVTVAALREHDARGRFGAPLGVPVITAPPRAWPQGLRSLGYARDLARLGRRARRARFDLVWERASARCDVGGGLARHAGVPHLLEVNAPLSLERGEDPGEGARLARADRVIAVSPWLGRWAESHGAREVRVVPNGTDVVAVDRDAARRTLGLNGTILVHHGSLGAWHGLDHLPRILEAVPEVRLVVVGEGDVPAHPRVSVLPFQDAAQLAQVLCAADVAVVPTPDLAPPWLDPLKIHDCRAAGLPVVGSVHPATRLADRQVPLLDPSAWRRAVLELAGAPRHVRERPWSAVCDEALRGINAR
ncbi:MAG: glycosyltransferase family 4 protein [Myxococcota bacterium]